jgi:Na+(H+)/acetate symporter ActP
MLLIIAINMLPLLVLGLAWWQYHKEASVLSIWRKSLFILALTATTVSEAILVGFLIHGQLIIHGAMKQADIERSDPVLFAVAVGLAGAILAGFGRRVSRWLLIGDSLLLLLLWYIAFLSYSP